MAIVSYIVLAAAVIWATYARCLQRDKDSWNGVTGNLMASLIEALALSAIAAGAFKLHERKRWAYARNLARARFVNAIWMAWSAVVGPDNPNSNRPPGNLPF